MNVLIDIDIDIDIFKSDLIDIDIDIFKTCRYIDNRYGLSIIDMAYRYIEHPYFWVKNWETISIVRQTQTTFYMLRCLYFPILALGVYVVSEKTKNLMNWVPLMYTCLPALSLLALTLLMFSHWWEQWRRRDYCTLIGRHKMVTGWQCDT